MTYIITFDRVGRNHDVKPLIVEAESPDRVARKIFGYVKPMLASRDVEVRIDLEAGNGSILCGFNIGGTFQIKIMEKAST